MSNAGAVSTLAKESTQIRRIAGTVTGMSEQARILASRLETWKSRVMGLHTDGTIVDEAPEPVRSDLEELQYQLEQTQYQLGRIESHLNDVESV